MGILFKQISSITSTDIFTVKESCASRALAYKRVPGEHAKEKSELISSFPQNVFLKKKKKKNQRVASIYFRRRCLFSLGPFLPSQDYSTEHKS